VFSGKGFIRGVNRKKGRRGRSVDEMLILEEAENWTKVNFALSPAKKYRYSLLNEIPAFGDWVDGDYL
jgi:hypothetical protein